MPFQAFRAIALGIAGALTATVAFAQTAPTARQTELAHRYIMAIHIDRTMDATMKAMIPSMLANMPQGDSAKNQAVIEAATEVMGAVMTKMVARMEPIMAETFTEKELTDLVAFYEGPTGQALMAKTPQMAAKMAPIMKDLGPEMLGEIMTKVCAKTDCTATQKAMAKPG